MIRVRHLAASLLASASIAGAQGNASCAKPNDKAPWLVAQRENFLDRPGTWSNDSLRSGLMAAVGLSGTTVEPQLGWELKFDRVTPFSGIETLDYLKKLGAQRGSVWPSRTVVGVGGVRAVYVLAHRDTTLLRVALKRMMEGGPDEGLKPDIAMLEDIARGLAGRKQLYGTQLASVNGKLVPLTIEDSAHVDLRREGANLPPLAWSVCNANSGTRK